MDKIIKYGIFLVLIFSPLMQIPSISTTYLNKFILCFDFIIIIIWLIDKIVKNKKIEIPENPFNFFIFCFCILAIISSFFSIDRKLIKIDLITTFESFCFFYIFLENIKDIKDIKKVLIILFFIAGLEGLYSLIQFINLKPTINVPSDVYRTSGTFSHPSILSTYIANTFPIILSLIIFIKKKIIRFEFVLLIFFMLCGIIFANARAGTLGVIISVITIGIIKFRWILKWILLLFILFFVVWLFFFKEINELLRIERGLSYRDYTWSYGIGMIKESPLFGSGLGSSQNLFYNKVFSLRGGVIETEELMSNKSNQLDKVQPFLHAHNTYITYAIEMGVIAPILFFWFFFIYYKTAFNVLKNLNDEYLKVLVVGFIGVFVEFPFHNFFQTLCFYTYKVISMQILLIVALTLIIDKIANMESLIMESKLS